MKEIKPETVLELSKILKKGDLLCYGHKTMQTPHKFLVLTDPVVIPGGRDSLLVESLFFNTQLRFSYKHSIVFTQDYLSNLKVLKREPE